MAQFETMREGVSTNTYVLIEGGVYLVEDRFSDPFSDKTMYVLRHTGTDKVIHMTEYQVACASEY